MRHKLPGTVMVVALVAALAANAGAEPAVKAKSAAGKTADAKAPPPLEPKALEILKAMSDRLAAAHTLSFTAVATYESPTRIGPALAYTTISGVTLQRPDKLRVITPGDGPASEFY